MTIKPVLVQPNELIYCPFHRKWEVYMGEDPALCDWCCQFDPCPMHGANSTGLGYDPFYVEDDGERDDELNEYQAERLERIRAKRGTKEREDLIRLIAEDKVTRKKSTVPRSLEPDAIDAIDLDDLFD